MNDLMCLLVYGRYQALACETFGEFHLSSDDPCELGGHGLVSEVLNIPYFRQHFISVQVSPLQNSDSSPCCNHREQMILH